MEPYTPEEANKRLDEAKKRYAKEYQLYLKVKAQSCDCDRAACSRCLELNSIKENLHSILKVW